MSESTSQEQKLHKPDGSWLQYLAHEMINLVDCRFYSRSAAAMKIRQRFNAIIESAQRPEAEYQQEQEKRRIRGEPEPKYWCAGMPGSMPDDHEDAYTRKRREAMEKSSVPKGCPVHCALTHGHEGPCHIETL